MNESVVLNRLTAHVLLSQRLPPAAATTTTTT